MASLNKVFLVGNLTRDPELRYTNNGSAVCEFGMAMNRVYTSNNEKKEEVCFVDVNVWGKQAEACDKYLKKGAPLLVEGRLHLDTWADKETQKQRSRLKVVAERTQFMGSPRGGSEMGNDFQQQGGTGNSYGGGGYQPPQQTQQQPTQPAAPTYGGGNGTPANNGYNQQQKVSAPAPMPAPAATQPVAPSTGYPASTPAPAPPPVTPAAAPANNAFNPNVEGSEDDIPF